MNKTNTNTVGGGVAQAETTPDEQETALLAADGDALKTLAACSEAMEALEVVAVALADQANANPAVAGALVTLGTRLKLARDKAEIESAEAKLALLQWAIEQHPDDEGGGDD
ncbi:hypothetical protein [Chitinilyticum litopenaei]|uniref:hypothetical protein n=1 Tax=Chitinilyticum litopenaei TaxID=1121276 RepID=UPI0003F835D9|nr:hypothetical protein [Chitinilyticum litopenaei]